LGGGKIPNEKGKGGGQTQDCSKKRNILIRQPEAAERGRNKKGPLKGKGFGGGLNGNCARRSKRIQVQKKRGPPPEDNSRKSKELKKGKVDPKGPSNLRKSDSSLEANLVKVKGGSNPQQGERGILSSQSLLP